MDPTEAITDIHPSTVSAYEATEYVILLEPELVFRVGEASSELDRLLEGH